MKQLKYGIPCAVRIRTFFPHALIALIALGAYILMFQFSLDGAVRSAAQYKRVKDSPVSEILFSGEQNPGETFYYLKDHALSGSTGENTVSDVFMVMPDTVYGQNCIYFSGSLAEGTCAVSANIAARYQLDVGDWATVIGTDRSFQVARILPAQSGIDEDYLHDGIIVLSYDSELLSKNFWYVTFATDGDAYRDLHRLVLVTDMAKGCAASILLYGCIAVAVALAALLVCEHFLFRRRLEDYCVLVALGKKRPALLGLSLAENSLKYFLPAIICIGLHASLYACYGVSYAVPALYFAAICAILCILYSLIVTRRLYYVKAK